ncbi:hypothetical protein HMPREF3206_01663 [Fusobacterium equinum]|uniref:Uncharacterized protein n=1 Tax=Fusobacterium equinum TaxID=134605 RepID=A0A133N946_9FUSO|nr:hypothetical protein HMPREF3206_01663 [Fusobacterium equinum]
MSINGALMFKFTFYFSFTLINKVFEEDSERVSFTFYFSFTLILVVFFFYLVNLHLHSTLVLL